MSRSFEVPSFYRSRPITALKAERRRLDPKRRDLQPTVVACGTVTLKIARHFGFCFGVENAIDIAYRAIAENGGRRVFLLSEIIHNPQVNADLIERGARFLMTPSGERLVDFSTLHATDIVIVPAFGTTLELQDGIAKHGIDPYFYDSTCPFVEKVWRRAELLGSQGFTVIVHGKHTHEETRATVSHSRSQGPTLVLLDSQDAELVVLRILGDASDAEIRERFAGRLSDGFDPALHLDRIGVVNQTTMLASETQSIAAALRDAMLSRYGPERLSEHFADTRDTLCYATNENQSATKALIRAGADLLIVVGGYNSSNTSHLVELAGEALPAYYIKDASEILGPDRIRHYSLEEQQVTVSEAWLPARIGLTVGITSGASCPDRVVETVIERFLECVPGSVPFETALESSGIEITSGAL